MPRQKGAGVFAAETGEAWQRGGGRGSILPLGEGFQGGWEKESGTDRVRSFRKKGTRWEKHLLLSGEKTGRPGGGKSFLGEGRARTSDF